VTADYGGFMDSVNVTALAAETLEQAREASSGRHVVQVLSAGSHKQLVVALTEGSALSEHENPGQARLLVLHGSVRLTAGAESWSGREGDLLVIPERRHDLRAETDAAVLLSFVKD
jgi:quercetin dioxygenase-like cupin family protein